ncbi:hypothetical protein [Streptomyces sp. NPDC055099]
MKGLDSYSAPVSGRIFDRLAHACLDLLSVEVLAGLVLALEAASFNVHAAALTDSARARHGLTLTSSLRKERTRNEQEVLSKRFWRSQDEGPLSPPGRVSVEETPGRRRGCHRRGQGM